MSIEYHGCEPGQGHKLRRLRSGRIAEPQGPCIHSEAMTWMNALIIDLKKQLLGYPPTEPITMERLNEFHKHYADLEQCRHPGKVY